MIILPTYIITAIDKREYYIKMVNLNKYGCLIKPFKGKTNLVIHRPKTMDDLNNFISDRTVRTLM